MKGRRVKLFLTFVYTSKPLLNCRSQKKNCNVCQFVGISIIDLNIFCISPHLDISPKRKKEDLVFLRSWAVGRVWRRSLGQTLSTLAVLSRYDVGNTYPLETVSYRTD